MKSKTIRCVQCNALFEPYNKRNRFCSERCKNTWGNTHRHYAHTCKGCGKSFTSSFTKAKYCSRSCALIHTVVKRKLVCVDCGKHFSFIGRTRKLRCAACHSVYWNSYYNAANAGSARKYRDQFRTHNPNWRADNTYRRIVRALPGEVRYKYRNVCYDYWPRCCAVCGSLIRVEVHHIDGDRMNYHPTNLVPLCKRHHNAAHDKPHKTRWTKEQYEEATFNIWPDGRQAIGIIAQQCAKANTANSENASSQAGQANAELGT